MRPRRALCPRLRRRPPATPTSLPRASCSRSASTSNPQPCVGRSLIAVLTVPARSRGRFATQGRQEPSGVAAHRHDEPSRQRKLGRSQRVDASARDQRHPTRRSAAGAHSAPSLVSRLARGDPTAHSNLPRAPQTRTELVRSRSPTLADHCSNPDDFDGALTPQPPCPFSSPSLVGYRWPSPGSPASIVADCPSPGLSTSSSLSSIDSVASADASPALPDDARPRRLSASTIKAPHHDAVAWWFNSNAAGGESAVTVS